ncbi:MAG: UvrD-helicase domain-containing protein, partial [Candidatus Aminicenantes bacterium]|nr:UvrD-helicase domain-containing protein [Candidatus Aminicenantes bacterium]
MARSILKLEASAGSGKTYRLALEYLSRLLLAFDRAGKAAGNPKQQRELLGSILAITFTVKAAQEMKRRILEKLKRFALSGRGQKLNADDKKFLIQLAGETSLSAERIIELSGDLIELVLCSYDDFHVKTIDSLMSAMIQVIAPDLDLPAAYETALNARDELEIRARALLADLADSEWTRLERTLTDLKKLGFAKGWKTDEGLAGNIIDLFHLGMRQGIATEDTTRKEPHIRLNSDLHAFREKLASLLKILNAGIENVNGRVVNKNLLESASAFAREENGLYQLDQLLTRAFFKKSDPNELLKKTAPGPYAEKLRAAYEPLHASQQAIVLDLSVCKTFPYTEFFPDFIQAWHEGKDTLFLEEFSQTLAGCFAAWGKNGFPYLYLKMSDRFTHFLFDEFQDTSTLQFKALAPLIDEVLSRDRESSLFIVGDRKQAIYRWRGGNSELMAEDTLKEEIPAIGNREEKGFSRTLAANWRSSEEIVKFNNQFWAASAISQVAAEPEIQKAQGRDGGYVELSLHEDARETGAEEADAAGDKEEGGYSMSGQQLLEIENIIAKLDQNGYTHSEIAVLVRKNIQVRDIIRHLNREGISTLSDQSLLLSANPRVNEIIAFLGFLDYPPADLYFHAFVNGEIFQAEATKRYADEMAAFSEEVFINRREPAYKLFQQKFPGSWSGLVEPFFQAVGFLPP